MDFNHDVIERSHQVPVLVDFWAPWCGPCKVLGPVLEQIAEEQKERFELVKINTEDYPDLAQTFQIYSIPNVKLFFEGEVIQEFAGALPKGQIERWLDEYLPKPPNDELEYLLSTEGAIPDQQFIKRLSQWLQDNPSNDEARLALAKHLLFTDPGEAQEWVTSFGMEHPYHQQGNAIQLLSEFLLSVFTKDHPVESKLLEIQESLKELDFENATLRIIDSVSIDSHFREDLPRKLGIAWFHYLGAQHELTQEHRRMFDMMLW